MNKGNYSNVKAVSFLSFLFILFGLQQAYAQTICIDSSSEQIEGVEDGFRYELWNQNSQGTACMTLGEGALFSGEWSGIFNYLSRRGLGYDQTQEHQEIGEFSASYTCDYNPNSSSGNSYLSVYGWTVDPLIEYYVIEDWRNWIPSMAADAVLLDEFTIDGSVYEIYENTRVDQPSIQGIATFQQYFSIRQDERNSGTIDISAHFEKWESLGLEMGKLHEVSIVVEGFESNGNFEFTELDIVADDSNLSVDDIGQDIFTLYPNPSNGRAYIQLKKGANITNLKIYDALGRAVIFQQETQNSRIEISNLNSGIYFVLFNYDESQFTSKLLVN